MFNTARSVPQRHRVSQQRGSGALHSGVGPLNQTLQKQPGHLR